MSDKVKELAAAVAANPDHPLRAWADHAFNMPALGRRVNEAAFEDGDGSWPVMEPLNPSPIYDINGTPAVRMNWNSLTNEVTYTRLRTDEVQERLTAEEE